MDDVPNILPMKQRRYAEIAISEIKVINSRNREQEQFEMNVTVLVHREPEVF